MWSFVYICTGDPIIKRAGCNPNSQFNPAIYLCMIIA